MFNLKAVSVLIFGLALTTFTVAKADSIVLGEFQGEGVLAVTQKDNSGNVSAYNTTCHLALNIDVTATSMDIPFGAITCNTGMNTWNESAIHLDIVDSKLLLDQQEVGSIAVDGTITFEMTTFEMRKVTIYHTDYSCVPSRIETKNYKLLSTLNYTLKPVDAKTYIVSQAKEVDTLQLIYKKEYPNCPAGTFYVPFHETRLLSGTVTKQ
ncbi:MAG: hypothetical protein H7336_16630 [Bacteriovorax sp.]|nr:hypothetical protein [Bacteriovorax sp.]